MHSSPVKNIVLLLTVNLVFVVLPAHTLAGELGEVVPWQVHELAHVPKEHTVEITAQRHAYRIDMGGTVDMDHAMTRHYQTWQIGWQPNESLTIENTGDVPCENPRIIINGRGDWYTQEKLLQAAISSAMSDQEKIYLIWEFCRQNRHHDSPLFREHPGCFSEMHDPVKMLNTYGAALCKQAGAIGASLFHSAGFSNPKPFVWELHGHMQCEVFASNRWQFMDIDQDVFYLDRENELPVSASLAAHDHDLARREFHFGPVFQSWGTAEKAVTEFGRDDAKTEILYQGCELKVSLRPGERIEYRWDNVGKWAMYEPEHTRRYVGNSRLIYEPRLDKPGAGAEQSAHVSSVQVNSVAGMAGDDAAAELVYAMSSAYVFCGGRITADFHLRGASDKVVMEVWPELADGAGTPRQVWNAAGPGVHRADVAIDDAIDPIHGLPKYRYGVRIRLISASGSGGAAVTNLALRGDIMVSPILLPRLRLGSNEVLYVDDSPAARKVRITYRWKETSAAPLLPAPQVVNPTESGMIRDGLVVYRWKPVAGAGAYHLQVSRDPAMRWPYRPSLDVVCANAEFSVPFTGIYATDTTYYWRVRTRNEKDIWGEWGPVRTFQWSGPRVPVNVRLEEHAGTFTLHWEPNPRGTRPVRYEVYSSDMRGFSISKTPYTMTYAGEMPANYLGETRDTRMVVAGTQPAQQTPAGVTQPQNLQRCYYRVVAIDEHGTPGGCSDYAEMPHPFIWTKPAPARARQPFRFQLQCFRDSGDLQFNHRIEPLYSFRDQEHLSFELLSGPQWLRIEPQTGLLTGTPPSGSTGIHRFEVRAVATTESPVPWVDGLKRSLAQSFDIHVVE